MRTQEFRFQTSPFSRSTRFPFTSTASPPAPLAIPKAPSASVESIEPRPPRPCEVGRPKGGRRKNRRQSHTFFFSTCCAYDRRHTYHVTSGAAGALNLFD